MLLLFCFSVIEIKTREWAREYRKKQRLPAYAESFLMFGMGGREKRLMRGLGFVPKIRIFDIFNGNGNNTVCKYEQSVMRETVKHFLEKGKERHVQHEGKESLCHGQD